MTTDTTTRRHYWQRHTDGEGRWRDSGPPPGEDLAALRRGLGAEAGGVPAMWPFYTTLVADGRRTSRLVAEHAALALFALHQQSRPQPMHRVDVGLGKAALALRRSDRFSQEAVDRRFTATANATTVNEVSMHLRGLISQLRVIGQPLDYTRLFRDLRDWQYPERLPAVRRRWGSQYFAWTGETPHAGETPQPASPDTTAVPASAG